MLGQFLLGSLLILATTAIHGLWTLSGVSVLQRHYELQQKPTSIVHDTLIISGFVLWFFIAMVIEVWLWAGVYLAIGALDTLEESLYFSTVSFSTLGYGDIILDKSWRLLGSFEAANGLFLFGWSTALIFVIVQRLHLIRVTHH